MKGIIIYEDYRGKKAVEAVKLGEVNYTCKSASSDDDWVSELSGIRNTSTQAYCNKDDTYDFETGALIALMKMCGREKALKAVEELYSLKEPIGADLDGDVLESKAEYLAKENKSLKEKNTELIKGNSALTGARDYLLNESRRMLRDKKELKEKYVALVAENEKLKNDCDKLQHGYIDTNMMFCMDKVKELEESNKCLCEEIELLRDYNKSLEDSRDRLLIESRNRLRDKIDLKEKYVALAAENEKLNNEVNLINDALNAWKKRYRDLNTANGDLVCENYKLKTDCEKLQHGYNDTYTLLCGGRQNGKQHSFLVDLFKKLDKKKVQEAYKKAYGDRVIWCTSQPEIHPLSTAIMELAINLGKRPVCTSIDEWAFKPVSKREKMWDDILKEGRTPVWVKREDIHDFLEECQVAGIKWSSGKLPLETMPFYMCDGYEGAYFFVMTSLDISKSKHCTKEFRHVMTWWTTACPEEVEAAIHYIRPMRWDLFKKGRIAVKVNKENYSEFCGKILSHFFKVGISAWNNACKFGYFVFNKDTNYVERILASDNDDIKEINRRKVVDWEDVR